MTPSFELTPQALDDLDEIFSTIAAVNCRAAERVESAIVAAFRILAAYPRMGSLRPRVTALPVRFWTIPRYRNYVVVYRPETKPIQVIAVLHGMRDLSALLAGRFS